MKELINIYDEFGWEVAQGYPKGTRIKTLRNEKDAVTFMLKLPKGFSINSHSHVNTEQHFILEGQYQSEGVIYKSGSYRLIPPHTDHGPFKSKNGALVLVIWNG